MGVIRWEYGGVGMTSAYVGSVLMARVKHFGRSDGKLTWRPIGFVPVGDRLGVEYYCWTMTEAMRDVEEAVQEWLDDAGLVPQEQIGATFGDIDDAITAFRKKVDSIVGETGVARTCRWDVPVDQWHLGGKVVAA